MGESESANVDRLRELGYQFTPEWFSELTRESVAMGATLDPAAMRLNIIEYLARDILATVQRIETALQERADDG